MAQKSIDPNLIHDQYNRIMKSVLNFQAWVLERHISSGFLAPFPDLRFASLSPTVSQYALTDFTVYRVGPVDKVDDVFNAYIRNYVSIMVKQAEKFFDGRTINVTSFEKSNGLTWRTYMDLVIEQLSEAMSA
jgi:hypothetical protein